MKELRAIIGAVVVLAGLGISGCGGWAGENGGGHKGTGEAPGTGTVIAGTTRDDRDNDHDHNDDDGHLLEYGNVADAVDSRSIRALVTRYFTAAANESGAAACSMHPSFVVESLAEEYANTPYAGPTCAAVMSKLFASHHAEIVGKNRALRIIRVGIVGSRSLVALDFPEVPEVRQVTARRIGSSWKMISMLDGPVE